MVRELRHPTHPRTGQVTPWSVDQFVFLGEHLPELKLLITSSQMANLVSFNIFPKNNQIKQNQ